MKDASHILVLVTTVLLRCVADCTGTGVKRDCVQRLSDFMSRLETARNQSEWELADICLDRYQDVVNAVAETLFEPYEDSNSLLDNDTDQDGLVASNARTHGDPSNLALSADFNTLAEPLGCSWDSFWNNFDEAWWPFE